MKSLVLAVTLAIVAIQLTCAAPTPENEKKEAAIAGLASEVVDSSPGIAEVKGEDVGPTQGLIGASTWNIRDATKGPAITAGKAQ